ncbi:D-isomer specific 2-hydroxyacid dehydrogenase family protein [Cryobacterium sp. BB736]|uniref:D-isomer specific 2-hydroxyacid dehydrogenase family protein n=1 Tax=Cryobacterium sp. BB736 TaxID=2746963 RepID=UPI00351C5C00
MLPEAEEFFVRAVESAGGTVAPLSDATRGVVWLSNERAAEFAPILASHPGINWVQLPFAGVDAFHEALAVRHAERDIVWTSAKGAYAQPVAEHALALTLAALRGLPERARATEWGGKYGRSLYGLNVVIVGAGGTALELVRLLEPFDVRVTIVRRRAEPVAGVAATVTSKGLTEALHDADVLVLAAALSAETERLIGARELAKMKPEAVLVNIARGRMVDTDALISALRDGRLAGAGVDVTDPEPLPTGHPLWSAPNVIITPHSADTPEMVDPLLAERVAVNVRAFLGHGPFVGAVDPASGY